MFQLSQQDLACPLISSIVLCVVYYTITAMILHPSLLLALKWSCDYPSRHDHVKFHRFRGNLGKYLFTKLTRGSISDSLTPHTAIWLVRILQPWHNIRILYYYVSTIIVYACQWLLWRLYYYTYERLIQLSAKTPTSYTGGPHYKQ